MEIDKLKLIAYDFDGVMTNNKVFVDEKGSETVQVNRADALLYFNSLFELDGTEIASRFRLI